MIGKLLGHTQVQTTARYAHLASDPVKQAATSISDRLALALLGGADDSNANKGQRSRMLIENQDDDAAAAKKNAPPKPSSQDKIVVGGAFPNGRWQHPGLPIKPRITSRMSCQQNQW
jgi:hypothetical protein